jgi:SulP family sulfate permease
MKQMADVTNVSVMSGDSGDDDGGPEDVAIRGALPRGVVVYEINGPFFFGAATAFKNAIDQVATRPDVLVIRMRHVPAMDATGLNALKDLVERSRRDGTRVILSEVHTQPMAVLARSPLLAEVGESNVTVSFEQALATALTVAER